MRYSVVFFFRTVVQGRLHPYVYGKSEAQKLFCVLSCSLCCEALAAINGLTFGGLEGHLALLAALYADCIEHLSCTLLRILLSGTALLASGGLVLKTSRCVELLLTCGEHELIATISALQCLVLVHV